MYKDTLTYNLLKLILYSKPSMDSRCLRNQLQGWGYSPVTRFLPSPYEVLESFPHTGKKNPSTIILDFVLKTYYNPGLSHISAMPLLFLRGIHCLHQVPLYLYVCLSIFNGAFWEPSSPNFCSPTLQISPYHPLGLPSPSDFHFKLRSNFVSTVGLLHISTFPPPSLFHPYLL